MRDRLDGALPEEFIGPTVDDVYPGGWSALDFTSLNTAEAQLGSLRREGELQTSVIAVLA